MLARQEIAQKSIDALSDDMREHRQETLEKLDLQHKALSLQLQMLQRMGAQMEAATEAAMRDMQSQRDGNASATLVGTATGASTAAGATTDAVSAYM